MSKYFQVNPTVEFSKKEVVEKLHTEKIEINGNAWVSRETLAEKAMQKECTLKHTEGRVILKIDIQSKNRYTFENGTTIRRERGFNNFNFREVNPSNAVVVSSDYIPKGANVLIDYTSFHDSNKIFDYDSGSGDIEFYSVKEYEVFGWKTDDTEWQPTKDSEFALRVFKPHEGLISGIAPALLKNHLYILTGELKGFIVMTVRASDYQIVFTDVDGKEGNIVRVKHSVEDNYDKEEIILINHELTEKLNNGELLIGLAPRDAKPLNKVYA